MCSWVPEEDTCCVISEECATIPGIILKTAKSSEQTEGEGGYIGSPSP